MGAGASFPADVQKKLWGRIDRQGNSVWGGGETESFGKNARVESYSIELPKCEAITAEVEVSKADAAVVALPRGGILVNHSKGTIQFGLPPETIKDAMTWGLSVPTTFVILGDEMFDRELGINIAEFEFPAYFNYFVFGKRVTLITTAGVEKRVRRIFQETLLGPRRECYDLSQDYCSSLPGGMLSKKNQDTHWPDFVQEGLALDSQREFISVDALLHFEIIDQPKQSLPMSRRLSQVDSMKKQSLLRPRDMGKVILNNENNTYVKWNPLQKKYLVREGKRTVAQVDHKFLKPRMQRKRKVTHRPFEVPIFGVTMLGTSHGFDPKGTTTGFVVWVNRRGIMVDPPPDSADVLRDMAIPARLIDGMLLTHCHADHDAGAFQKILADSSIKIYTTQTIMDSFIRKYAAISNLDPNFLRGLFVFERVKIGKNKMISGGTWSFNYSLHVIPTIGFEVKFAGEGIVYSGDTCTNYQLFEKMRKEKKIGKGRYEDLMYKSPLNRGTPARKLPDGSSKPAYRPHILHEAGVPPIHTPLDTLAKLSNEIRDRLFVVHVDERLLRESKHARKLKTIPQWSTLRIDIDQSKEEVIEKDNCLVALLSTVPFFKFFKSHDLLEQMLPFGKVTFHVKGTVLAKQGDIWEYSHVIRAGVALETSSLADIQGEDIEGKPSDEEVKDEGSSADAKGSSKPANTLHKPTYYHVGDFFGEQSLIVDKYNTTDPSSVLCTGSDVDPRIVQYTVVAHTDLYTISFPRENLLAFLRSNTAGEAVLKNINYVAKARVLETWNVLRLNDTLDKIMNRVHHQEFQKLLVTPKHYQKNKVVFAGGEKQDYMFFISSGTMNFFFKPTTAVNSSLAPKQTSEEIINVDLGIGTLVGDVNSLKENAIAHHVITTKTACTVYEIPRIAILNFWNRFPGIKLQCIDKKYIQ